MLDLCNQLICERGHRLARNAYTSAVRLSLDLDRVMRRGLLTWPEADLNEIDQHDNNRITEDGAEAVALALAHRHRAWTLSIHS
jgi:hypothetical protein